MNKYLEKIAEQLEAKKKKHTGEIVAGATLGLAGAGAAAHHLSKKTGLGKQMAEHTSHGVGNAFKHLNIRI